jgi:1-acyl-sn-glycerol-3-phosphate acyltransferase
MTSKLDGFDPRNADAFVGYDEAQAERFWSAVQRTSKRLRATVVGIDRIPAGRALLVMNHAFGWDAMVPMAGIRAATGRRVWALGEHLWWKLPLLRRAAAAVGTVDGTPANVDRLLAADELVMVLPGGMREAMKPIELRYRLLWGDRHGFVRAALRNGAPLVPVAGFGADEVFDLVGDAYARGRRWLGRDFPIPRPAWGLPFPHRRPLRYVVGEPVLPRAFPGETEEETVRRVRREIRGALEELIADGLASRLDGRG